LYDDVTIYLGEPKDRDLEKGSVPFRERFVVWESWETHERLSLYEQLRWIL